MGESGGLLVGWRGEVGYGMVVVMDICREGEWWW